MSYRKTYRESITLSGSVNVNYPASERGGSTSVPWQHTEAISIDVTVETAPFDRSVDGCNGHLLALGAAVGVMNTAHCAAIQQGTTEISSSLEKGFFGIVKAELSQQLADLKHQLEAKRGLMVQQARSSRDGLERMRRDFERIVSRYQQLFRNLDEECRYRVLDLDRPSFRLAHEAVDTLLLRQRLSLAATSLTISREVGETQSLLVVSRLRRRALGMLESVKGHLLRERATGRSLREIVLPRPVSLRTLYLPVLVMVADNDGGTTEVTIQWPDGFSANVADGFQANVTRDPDNAGSWNWTAMPPSVSAQLQREYLACIAKNLAHHASEADHRKATLMENFGQSNSALCVVARQ